jgi:ankyrin repeat protein
LGLLPQIGYTPLHWAAFKSNAEVMGLLLAAGAAVDAANEVRPPHMQND